MLGTILLDDSFYVQSAGTLEVNDFSLEKHRRIYKRMGDVYERGEKIDRITVANELMKFGELESCDGLSYLVSLDDGLPQIPNVDAYIRLVKDKAILRSIIFASEHMRNRAMMGEESPNEILAGAEETLLKLGEAQVKSGLLNPDEILQGYEGGISAFLDPSKRVKGVSTGFLKLDEYTGGMHGGDLFILAGRPSMGKTAFALNIAQHVALRNKQTVAVFSLEMSKESLLTRMPARRPGWTASDSAPVTLRRTNAAGSTSRCRIWWRRRSIDDTAGLHSWTCMPSCGAEIGTQAVGLVIVDYLS